MDTVECLFNCIFICGINVNMEIICNCKHEHPKVSEFTNEECLSKLEKFYSAFSTRSRLVIIDALDKTEMCVCELARHSNMTKSAISHQLKILKDLRLVKSRKIGKEVFYSLADNHVKSVFEISLDHIKELGEDICKKNI